MSEVNITGGPMNPERAKEIVLDEAHKAMRLALAHTEATWKGRLVPGVRGYRTGTYARSITNNGGRREGDRITGTVGSNLFYAPLLEYGTGLYGPRHRWITPVKAHALRFPEPGNRGFTLAGRQRSGRAGAMARYIYAKRIRGIKPRRYARDAALIARPWVESIFRAAGQRAAERISRGG
jgi:hypothetical protein